MSTIVNLRLRHVALNFCGTFAAFLLARFCPFFDRTAQYLDCRNMAFESAAQVQVVDDEPFASSAMNVDETVESRDADSEREVVEPEERSLDTGDLNLIMFNMF